VFYYLKALLLRKIVWERMLQHVLKVIIIIIVIYLLQLGLHPVAVVLTLHNYNKNIQ
jgi:hypothetical protein